MDSRWVGNNGFKKQASVGDLVICVDRVRCKDYQSRYPKRFIALVLDKSLKVYKIKVVGTGEEFYWPSEACYLWKETK